MKQPKALPTPARPTHGPYASSMAAPVRTTNASTTRTMTCMNQIRHHCGALPRTFAAMLTPAATMHHDSWLQQDPDAARYLADSARNLCQVFRTETLTL